MERQGVIMSTSQVCEINNNKKFTVLNLQIVCQKECGTIKWGHFFSRQIILSMQGKHASHLSRLFQILNTAINQKTQKNFGPKHFQPYQTEKEWKRLIICDGKIKVSKQVHLLPKFIKMTPNCTCLRDL